MGCDWVDGGRSGWCGAGEGEDLLRRSEGHVNLYNLQTAGQSERGLDKIEFLCGLEELGTIMFSEEMTCENIIFSMTVVDQDNAALLKRYIHTKQKL